MSFEVLSCHGTDAARWQSFYERLPPARRAVHFSPAYARVQAALDQGQPMCAVYEYGVGDFMMQPFLLRRFGSWARWDIASFYGGGGVVGSGISAPWIKYQNAFAAWRSDNRVVAEFCSLHPLVEAPFDAERVKDIVVMPCPADEATFRQTRRHCIGKARAMGVQVFRAEGQPQGVARRFAAMYDETMDRHGAPRRWRFRPGYFEAHLHELPDHCIVLEAVHDKQVVSMAMVLVGGPIAYYHFAANTRMVEGAGDLMVVEAARLAERCGASRLNLGGGVKSAEDDSLLLYKSSFSKERHPCYVFRRVFDQRAYDDLCERTDAKATTWFPAYRQEEATA